MLALRKMLACYKCDFPGHAGQALPRDCHCQGAAPAWSSAWLPAAKGAPAAHTNDTIQVHYEGFSA